MQICVMLLAQSVNQYSIINFALSFWEFLARAQISAAQVEVEQIPAMILPGAFTKVGGVIGELGCLPKSVSTPLLSSDLTRVLARLARQAFFAASTGHLLLQPLCCP